MENEPRRTVKKNRERKRERGGEKVLIRENARLSYASFPRQFSSWFPDGALQCLPFARVIFILLAGFGGVPSTVADDVDVFDALWSICDKWNFDSVNAPVQTDSQQAVVF